MSELNVGCRVWCAGLLLLLGACTLSTDDIHLTDPGAGDGRGGVEGEGTAGEPGSGGARPDDTAGSGGSLGRGGSPGASGEGGTAGQPEPTGRGGGGAGMSGGAGGVPAGGSGPSLPPPVSDGTGGATGAGGSVATPSGGTSGDPSPPPRATSFDFETDTQGWQDLKDGGSQISRSTQRAFSGAASLEIVVTTKKDDMEKARYIGVPQDATPLLRPGQTVRFHIFVPSSKDNALVGVQPFVISAAGVWQGLYRNADALMRDRWLDLELKLPSDFDTQNLLWFGVQVLTREDGPRVTIYVDGVTF